MNNFDRIKKICKPVRMLAGATLISAGFITGITWLFLGIIPLIAGAVDFCPLCLISKKCTI